MKIIHQTGFGNMKDEKGNDASYPINRIILRNSKGGEISLKMDKIAKALLPYIIEKKSEAYGAEDANGQNVTEAEIQ